MRLLFLVIALLRSMAGLRNYGEYDSENNLECCSSNLFAMNDDDDVDIKEDSIRRDYQNYENESDPEQSPPKAIATHDESVDIKEDSIRISAPQNGRTSSLTRVVHPCGLHDDDTLRAYTNNARLSFVSSVHVQDTRDASRPSYSYDNARRGWQLISLEEAKKLCKRDKLNSVNAQRHTKHLREVEIAKRGKKVVREYSERVNECVPKIHKALQNVSRNVSFENVSQSRKTFEKHSNLTRAERARKGMFFENVLACQRCC